MRSDGKKDFEAVLSIFHSRGYRHLDTASNYGIAEERLGQTELVSQFIIDTKISGGTPGSLEPVKIKKSIDESLEALGGSTVETLFIHAPDRQTPLKDILKAINDAFLQRKFKKFGICSYSVLEVRQIFEICEEEGYVKPSIYQGQYNALVRGGEKNLFPLLREHGMSFYAFR